MNRFFKTFGLGATWGGLASSEINLIGGSIGAAGFSILLSGIGFLCFIFGCRKELGLK